MIRGLYTAASGMTAQQQNIDVISNNIANVNTTGFKQDRAEFQDLMYQSLNYTAGATSSTTNNPTGIDVGLGVRTAGIQKNFGQGSLKETGNSLDLAVAGNGFFKVTTPNGETAYSRDGSFKKDNEGSLVNGSGFKLDPEIVIPDNLVNISIAEDGTVTGTDASSGDITQLGQITLATFINPSGLSPQGSNLYLATEVSGDPIDGIAGINGMGTIRQGMLESSNVQLVTEMVNLITAQRAYEANSKSITTTDTMLQTVNQLKR
ncbi:MAG: flagellar basal-body rod protein FlgG [Campylobacterota bacterium]|nr:flagellar basal-body rod protein FlgG [Campylobacterota bacterium]